MTTTSKRPLILWSGGFDSTCLVIRKLREGDVDILYVDLENNWTMQRQERRAILKLKCLLKDANLPGRIINEYNFRYGTITITKDIYVLPALWVQAGAITADPAQHTELIIGYVKYDDIWHYKTEIINAYTALNDLISYGGDKVPLVFPFEWDTKANLLDRLEDFVYHKQVMNLIHYCEGGKKEPCGECGSCKRHNNELSYD